MNSTQSKVALFAVCSIAAGTILAQDWPQWRGLNRDGHATAFKAPPAWPDQLNQQWDVAVGDGDATPALVGNRLFVFARKDGREVIRCLDAANGKELWQDAYDAQGATGPSSRHAGPRSSPVVAGGKVITYGVRGMLSCLEADSGKVLWRKDDFTGAWPQFFTASSPVVADNLCVAQLGGSDNGGIVAYDMVTGEPKWKWTRDGAAYASPALLAVGGTKLLVTLTDENVVLLGLEDGKLLWESPFVPERRAYNAATPIVDGQTVVFTGAGRGTKAIRVAQQGDAFAVTELWSNSAAAVQYNSPVLSQGWIYGLSQGGDLFCLSQKDGQTAWTAPTGDRGGFGTIVSAGQVLLLLTPKAELVVFPASSTEYKPIKTYKVADAETYAYPVVSGNRIYVKDQDSVALWTVD
ncbi:MAG: PQQ-binding-like beta-propeller repeat protein [Verrucomicrobia bacterium]|nr:PQQ-binding-like beta-propeller repeat protein [Verrucomicrobiota bacterium]